MIIDWIPFLNLYSDGWLVVFLHLQNVSFNMPFRVSSRSYCIVTLICGNSDVPRPSDIQPSLQTLAWKQNSLNDKT